MTGAFEFWRSHGLCCESVCGSVCRSNSGCRGDRPHTGERHVCVRPVSAERVESVNIDEVQGHSRSLFTCCAYSKLQITGTDSHVQVWQGILSPRTYGRHRT